jgi:hypothetical protein
VNFREDLAAVLETPPSDALERVLRAAEVSEDVGADQLVSELTDPINQIIDDLPSEDEIISRVPDAHGAGLWRVTVSTIVTRHCKLRVSR